MRESLLKSNGACGWGMRLRFEERFHRPTAIHRLHPHDAAATKDAVRAARDAGPTAAVPRHTPPTPSGMARRPPTFLQPRTPATSPQQNPKVKRIPWACGSGMRPFCDTPIALFAFSGRGVRKGMRLRFCQCKWGANLLPPLPVHFYWRCCRNGWSFAAVDVWAAADSAAAARALLLCNRRHRQPRRCCQCFRQYSTHTGPYMKTHSLGVRGSRFTSFVLRT